MKELVFSNNGQTVTNSLLVAEKFGRDHKNVIQAIENLIGSAENSAITDNQRVSKVRSLFVLSDYDVPLNNGTRAVRKAPMYIMNRDGFSLLVMGFTGQKALEFKMDFIEAFNEYERKAQSQAPAPVLPKTYKEALQSLLIEVEHNEHLQAENEAQQAQLVAQAPKVLFADTVIGSQSSCLIGELAKLITQKGYEIGEKRLFKWLRENHYLGTRGEYYNIPNQQYIEQGLFELKKGTRSGNGGVMHTTITPKVTGKGQVFFVNKFLKNLQTIAQPTLQFA